MKSERKIEVMEIYEEHDDKTVLEHRSLEGVTIFRSEKPRATEKGE